MQTKTMVLTSVAPLLEETTKVLLSILSQMIINNLLLSSQSLNKKSLNLFQTQFS
jgi:hypothetical protein